MKKTLAVLFALAATTLSAATSYRVTLFQPSVVAGTELKAGEYKIEVNNEKARLLRGKDSVEADVKVENAAEKFGSTSIRYANENGKYKVTEIRIGGTSTKLVFN